VKTIELELLEPDLQERLLAAVSEPILVTQHEQPVLVIRNLVDDDAADELIAQNPGFLDTIRKAREEKAQGRVRQLAELRTKYAADEEISAGEGL
jgi:hypothetical protein